MALPSILRSAASSTSSRTAIFGTAFSSTRYFHLEASPNASQETITPLDGPGAAQEKLGESGSDAKFEVTGSTSSMLSVSLSASQDLYSRRGTLVGVSGNAKNVMSSLSTLQPLQRFATGIPFLYQKITSSTPVTALIAAKSSADSFIVVPLDGRLDWVVAQRTGLLAWTGRTLSLKPRINYGLSLSHWGNTFVTGRGLMALAGRGQIYELTLKQGEEYVVHPSHVLAYSSSSISSVAQLPTPYRLPYRSFRLQLPQLAWRPAFLQSLQESQFISTIRNSIAWRYLSQAYRATRTRLRAFVFGDRLFLRFSGPSTILVQSRGGRIRDVLSDLEINEIAGTQGSGAPRTALVKTASPTVSSESTAQAEDGAFSKPN